MKWHGDYRMVDLIDAMIEAADSKNSDADVAAMERSACPTCGSCSGMFTANSMNCLTEALGLSCPATARCWRRMPTAMLFRKAGQVAVDPCRRWYEKDDASVLPRSIASFWPSRTRSRSISRWADRPTPCCTFSPPRRRLAGVNFTMADIDRMSRKVPPGQGGTGDAAVPHGRRASRRRHHGHSR